jgi:hypothetical protein
MLKSADQDLDAFVCDLTNLKLGSSGFLVGDPNQLWCEWSYS